jgi:hypothetical protein
LTPLTSKSHWKLGQPICYVRAWRRQGPNRVEALTPGLSSFKENVAKIQLAPVDTVSSGHPNTEASSLNAAITAVAHVKRQTAGQSE